jgi:ATP-dependent DNA helicase RecG
MQEARRHAPISLDSPVTSVTGVGSIRQNQLARLSLYTIGDLLFDAPRRYEDRRKFSSIKDLVEGSATMVSGRIVALGTKTFRQRSRSVFEFILDDGTARLHCRWWNVPHMERFFSVGDELVVHGKPRSLRPRTMDHPETERLSAGTIESEPKDPGDPPEAPDDRSIHVGRIVPIYSLTEGLGQRARRWIAWNALRQFGELIMPPQPDLLESAKGMAANGQAEMPAICAGWPSRRDAIRQIHFPTTDEEATRARERLAVDEFIRLQLEIQQRRKRLERNARALPCGGDNRLMRPFLASLGFRPTKAQSKALKEIRSDMGGEVPMRRLIQGDVGSGKTLVAAGSAIMALESGYHVALMAPTEILAGQLHRVFDRWLGPLGVPVNLRTGSGKTITKGPTLFESAPSVTVGTHALIEDRFIADNLGLVIIDEQHRFGVAQREKLLRKGRYPHLLVMTATPIPRTLGLTLYGDLDVSVLDEKPAGRSKIRTHLRTQAALPKVWAFIRGEIEKGHRAYVVYPRVSDTGEEDVKSVEAQLPRIASALKPYKVGGLHGRMPADEKDRVMGAFRSGDLNVLVATSVIEVGVDVPEATVMVIEHADQFGLAQLHQLRGRIGRGAAESHCILIAGEATENGQRRLKALVETDDGFAIAEADFRLRGPGELTGRAQSGLPDLKFGNLIEDRPLMEVARDLVRRHLADAPGRPQPV